MKYEVKEVGNYKFVDVGEGEVLLLLHGLFGALSNWEDVIEHFSKEYRVIIPILPIYDMPIKSASVDGLVQFVENFVGEYKLKDLTILGNSLGGHIGLVYTLRNNSNVKRLVLTGSSGLFENGMGGSFPKRGDKAYIEERVRYTFYDPNTATDELIQEVFHITSNIRKGLNIVSIAKSAQRHNLANDISVISQPVLLVWGLNDTITPPSVAHEFNRLLKNSELCFIDKCGHAPMMEQPQKFNAYLDEFLKVGVPV